MRSRSRAAPTRPDATRSRRRSRAERWTSWLRLNQRAAQLVVDVAMIATIVLTFAHTFVPADVMFHVVFVLLTVHAFLFGLRGTLLRIGIVSLPLLAFANARLFGWDQPAFDLSEWPLMFVIAVLVAWMADRRDATARRYASLFRQASERLLTVEEDERRRIALELHDGVGQVLAALTLTLDAAGDGTPQGQGHGVASARGLAGTALAEVRHLAHRMRPARLEERGLTAAIRDLAGPVRLPGARARGRRGGRPRLGPRAERHGRGLSDRAGGPGQRRPAQRRPGGQRLDRLARSAI